MDIEINSWSPFFVNLKISLIFSLYIRKLYNIQPIEWLMQNPEQPIRSQENLKVEWKNSHLFEYGIEIQRVKKSGLSKNLKVSPLDICLGQAGFFYSIYIICLGQAGFLYSIYIICLGQAGFLYSIYIICLGQAGLL